MIVWFLFGAMCMFVVLLGWAYLKLNALTKEAQKTWQKLDNRLKNRAELLPSLSFTVSTLPELNRDELQQKLTELTKPSDDLPTRVQKENEITQTLKQVFTAVMHHPNVEQEPHFKHLQESIISAEGGVQRAKQAYNTAAHNFNTISGIIPLNWVAQVMEMDRFAYFDFDNSTDKK